MVNVQFKKFQENINAFYKTPRMFSLLTTLGAIGFYFYSGDSCALVETDKVAEIATLTTEVTKIAKNGCYITGCASALIGAIFAVAQQSLKIFGVAAAVTLLAFKAPSFFTSAMLI